MKILKILFTINRVFKHKEVVSICMIVLMAWGMCDFHIHFTFLPEF